MPDGARPGPQDAIDFSDAAVRIARFLSAESKAGLERDPWVEVDDLIRDLQINDDTLEAAVAELQQQAFVVVSDDANHRLAFHALAPLPALFWWADEDVHGRSPMADAKQVARALVAADNRTGFVDVAALASSLGWPPRRINPAVAYLVQNQHVREIRHLGGGPYGGYALHCTGATKAFVARPLEAPPVARPAEAPSAALPVEAPPRGLYVVMFTDVVGSTALALSKGSAGARKILKRHDQVIKLNVQTNGGRIVNRTGDGVYAVFPMIHGSMEAALGILDGLAQLNKQFPDEPVPIRIALDLGDLLPEDDDLHGLSVNRAARILKNMESDRIVASPAVAAAAEGYEIDPIGPRELKDFGSVALFEVKGRLPGCAGD